MWGLPLEPVGGPPAPRRPSRWRRAALVAAALLVFAGSFVTTLAYHLLAGVTPGGRTRAGSDVLPRTGVAADEPFNVLILGEDVAVQGGPTRSDTIMLASVDPVTGTLSLLSIPRDTYVRIPPEAADPGEHVPAYPTKINHAYAYGGADLAAATVERLLGVPVHRFVTVDVRAFQRIVDLLGGVDICVEKRMVYEDPYQDLRIDLRPGCQRLDGQRAMQYVRYRLDSDIARIQRQQKFMRALVERALSLGLVPRLPSLAHEFAAAVRTDLDTRELLWLASLAARYGASYDPSRLQTATLPGRSGHVRGVGSVWLVDEEEAAALVDRLVWRVDPDRNRAVRVAIEDAGGGPAAVAAVERRLREAGYQVVAVRPASRAASSGVVVHRADRVLGVLALRALRRWLPGAALELRPDQDVSRDLTVRVGADARDASAGGRERGAAVAVGGG